MTRKQTIALITIGAMLVVGGILALGDLRTTKHSTTGIVTSVIPEVEPSGIVLAVAGSRESCELITSWEQKLKGDLIVVTPVFTVTPDAACDAMVPFEESVVIKVGDLSAGTYRIDVLGVVISVTLTDPIISFDFKTFSNDSFNRFIVPVAAGATKANLDLASFSADMPIAQLQQAWTTAAINFADRLSIISLSCGEGCTNEYVIDFTTGKLVRQFTSSFPVRAHAGSTLFILNDPEAIASAGTADPVAAEAYMFEVQSRTFIFLAQGDYLFGELQN